MTGRDQRGVQKSLIDEEWSEFHEAYHMKDDCDQLKELADLVYVCYQFAASQEWDLDEAMRRVHESNMSKISAYTFESLQNVFVFEFVLLWIN